MSKYVDADEFIEYLNKHCQSVDDSDYRETSIGDYAKANLERITAMEIIKSSNR